MSVKVRLWVIGEKMGDEHKGESGVRAMRPRAYTFLGKKDSKIEPSKPCMSVRLYCPGLLPSSLNIKIGFICNWYDIFGSKSSI